MTDGEIYRLWKSSHGTKGQIKILAECNACSEEEIREKIRRYQAKLDKKDACYKEALEKINNGQKSVEDYADYAEANQGSENYQQVVARMEALDAVITKSEKEYKQLANMIMTKEL